MGFFFYGSDTTPRLHRWVLIQSQSAFPDFYVYIFPFQFQLSRCLSPSPTRRRATSHLKPPTLFHVSSSASAGVRLSPPLRRLRQWDAILFISTRSRLFPTDSPRCRFCRIHTIHLSRPGAQVSLDVLSFGTPPQGFYMHYVGHLWEAVHWPFICIWRERGAGNETDSWHVTVHKLAMRAAELIDGTMCLCNTPHPPICYLPNIWIWMNFKGTGPPFWVGPWGTDAWTSCGFSAVPNIQTPVRASKSDLSTGVSARMPSV